MKSWLENNDKEMFSMYINGRSGVAQRFIRTFKTKIYKYMTSMSKNMYIDKLDDKVEKYNSRTIKMKPVNLKVIRILTLVKNLMIKDLNFELIIM